MTEAIEVFFSYSHKDEELRNELETHLAILRRQGIITTWHDRKIGAGTEWANQIDENLRKADIVLLLVSAYFLASDYCWDMELDLAVKQHEAGKAIVIPIILRPVNWSGAPFSKLQAFPTDAKPVTSWLDIHAAFTNVADGISAAAIQLREQRKYEEALQEQRSSSS